MAGKRRKLSEEGRTLIMAWHLLRGILVRSESSKIYHFAKAAYHAKKLAKKRLEADEAERLGLTKSEYLLLLTMARGRDFTVKELAQKTGLSESTIRKNLKTFVKAGIAERDESQVPYIYRLKEDVRAELREALESEEGD
mgnify:CR=1 FL=1